MALIYAATEVSGGNIIDVINGLDGAGTPDGTAFTTESTLNLGNPEHLQSVTPLSIVMRIKTNASPSGSIFLGKDGRFFVRFESNSSKTLTFLMDGAGGDGIVTSPTSSFALDTYFDLVLRWDGTNINNQIFIDVNGVSTQGAVSGSTDFSGADTGDFIINNSAGDVTFEYLYIYDEFLSYADGETIRANPDLAINPPNIDPTLDTPKTDESHSFGWSGTIDMGAGFSDANAGDTLTFSDDNNVAANSGISFNTATGVYTLDGTLSVGVYSLTVTASDGNGGTYPSDTAVLTITAPALSVDSISDTTPEYDSTITVQFTDADGALTANNGYTIASQNVVGNVTTAVINVPNPSTFVLTGQTVPTLDFLNTTSIPVTDGTTTVNVDIQIQIKAGEFFAQITEVNGVYLNDTGVAIGDYGYFYGVVGDWFIDPATGLVSAPATGGSFSYKTYDGEWSNEGDVTADARPTGTVTITSVTPSRTSAVVVFSYSGTDASAFQYNIGGSWITATSPFTITGLTEETSYTLQIRPLNGTAAGDTASQLFTTNSAIDTSADPFTFTDVTGQAVSSSVTSNAVTLTGVDAGVDIPVSITGGSYQVSTNGGSNWGAATSSATNGRLNYQYRVVLSTSASFNASTAATLTIGGQSDTFTATTLADTQAPSISLTGGNQTLAFGVAWVELGYSATDNADGDLTNDVVVSGTVNSNSAGVYPITYTVSDSVGNETVATRLVTVEAEEAEATYKRPRYEMVITESSLFHSTSIKLVKTAGVYLFVNDGEFIPNAPAKDPSSKVDYGCDWSNWLSTGETITASVWVLDGLVEEVSTNTDSATQVLVSGGTDGTQYTLVNRVTTSLGRIEDRSMLIECMQK